MTGKMNLTLLADFYELTMANGYWEHGIAEQIAYCRARGISLTAEEYASPKVIHAITAPTFIEENFPLVKIKSLLII